MDPRMEQWRTFKPRKSVLPVMPPSTPSMPPSSQRFARPVQTPSQQPSQWQQKTGARKGCCGGRRSS